MNQQAALNYQSEHKQEHSKSFRWQNVIALFANFTKNTIKSNEVIVLFLIFPVIAGILVNSMPAGAEAGGPMLFISIFSLMHCVFTPLVASSAIIAEDKEKNTLRVLIMSNIRMGEYLAATTGFILFLTLLTGSAFLLINPTVREHGPAFMGCMAVGCLTSASLGMCLGLQAKSVAAANAVAVPFGMIFGFLPMLASFNADIEKVARFTYGQQLATIMKDFRLDAEGMIIIAVNLVLLLGIGVGLYRRNRRAE